MSIVSNEVINLILSVIYAFMVVGGICLFFQVSTFIKNYFAYKNWDGGINLYIQEDLQVHCPLDPSKGILYIPRRVVGFWKTEKHIYNLSNEVDNKNILNMLAKNYNLILYIPERDRHQIIVDNLESSIKFIIENEFPICYITQHLPPRNKITPFSCNDEKLWFIEYKKGDKINRWEGYS